jgi:hypothetical protein
MKKDKKKKEVKPLSQGDLVLQGGVITLLLLHVFIFKNTFLFLILFICVIAIKMALDKGYKITEMNLFIKDTFNSFAKPK